MSEKKIRDFAKTKHEGLPVRKEETECGSDSEKKDGEEDPRSMKTKVNLVKNKLRAMGLKMSYEPDGEMVDEAAQRVKGKLQSGTRTFSGDGYYGRGSKEKKNPKEMKRIFPGPKSDKESDGGDHPSLSAAERNPNLR
jgi:hypothetical protein